MRILFVCTDADIGGAERFLATLARARDASDQVRLVVLLGRGSLSQELDSAFDEVVYLDYPPSSRNLIGMVRSLQQEISQYDPDIISSHLFHADLVTAMTRSKAPKTSTVHTQGFGSGDHPLTKMIARAVGMLSYRFAAVVPASDSASMADFLRRLRMRNVVSPILNGVDVPDAASFDTASRRFLSLARNHPVKGHADLFGAFAQIAGDIPEWTLRAMGPGVVPDDGAMRDALGAEGAALVEDGRISLGGPTSTPTHELADAAALVISSTYGEAFPMVGAEAASVGIPVITTDVGNCSEFADDKSFVVAPGVQEALARAMLAYARLSDGQRAALSRTARERAESRYSAHAVFTAYRRLFESLMKRGVA